MAVGIQADPDAVLRLELRDRRPGLHGVRHRGVRSSTRMSRCAIICCAPSAVGQVGRT